MSGVLGTFSDARPVKTRSVVQLIIEVPIEDADDALAALGGFPQPGKEKWVGVALAPRDREAASSNGKTPEFDSGNVGSTPTAAAKPKRKFSELSLPQQAGIRCDELRFRQFLGSNGYVADDADAAAATVRYMCGIASRSELSHNHDAANKWRKLDAEYERWLTTQTYADSIR